MVAVFVIEWLLILNKNSVVNRKTCNEKKAIQKSEQVVVVGNQLKYYEASLVVIVSIDLKSKTFHSIKQYCP